MDVKEYRLNEAIKTDCRTAQAIIDKAKRDAKNPPDYNFINDCRRYSAALGSMAKGDYAYICD